MDASYPATDRIETVADLVQILDDVDPTLPLRVALDERELAAHVAAVVELPTDERTGWTRGVWLRVTGGVEPGRHPYAPRDVWPGGEQSDDA